MNVEYEWKPSSCSFYKQFGHATNKCLKSKVWISKTKPTLEIEKDLGHAPPTSLGTSLKGKYIQVCECSPPLHRKIHFPNRFEALNHDHSDASSSHSNGDSKNMIYELKHLSTVEEENDALDVERMMMVGSLQPKGKKDYGDNASSIDSKDHSLEEQDNTRASKDIATYAFDLEDNFPMLNTTTSSASKNVTSKGEASNDPSKSMGQPKRGKNSKSRPSKSSH